MTRAALTLLVVGLTAGTLAAQTPQAAQAPQTGTSLQVADAKLGTGVTDRELTGDPTTTFKVGDTVYLWLNVTGGPSADPITVTWKSGDFSYAYQLPISGSRWRTWATKQAFKAGDWTVTVTDAAGTTLKELPFTVQ
jgi:Protein of unknown function (DUF2914)